MRHLESQSVTLSASDGYKGNPYIHTQGGRWHAFTPTWNVDWMAHSLAQTARYRGHTDEQYSVAEHSVLVSLLMQEVTGGDPREGLFHDATESVLPDVSSPLKQLFPDLVKFEKELDADLRKKFRLPPSKTNECKHADWLALFIESATILPERGADFEDPFNLRPQALKLKEREGWGIICLPWRKAKEAFLERNKELQRA